MRRTFGVLSSPAAYWKCLRSAYATALGCLELELKCGPDSQRIVDEILRI